MSVHGYICKTCAGPSPVGVGYVDDTPGAAEHSAGLTACACGASRLAGPAGDDTDETKAAVGAAILAAFPDAVSYEISSSDQGSGGWVFYGVTLTDGTYVDDGETVRQLDNQIGDDLLSLPWGVFGDRNGDAALTIDVRTHLWMRDQDR